MNIFILFLILSIIITIITIIVIVIIIIFLYIYLGNNSYLQLQDLSLGLHISSYIDLWFF